MKLCIVIPYYNHGDAIATVLASLRNFDLPCFVVDDGSNVEAKAKLTRAAGAEKNVIVLTREENGGKGAAVMTGCDGALAAGFTHALQIDADGQHSANDVARFIATARTEPDAVICGRAIYDDSVPQSRLYGRYVTHVWVWINTLSFQIKDSMCGLRVYPLATTCNVWRHARLGKRMEFDVEIMVRLAWAGVPVVNVAAHVNYPTDGVSHFRVWRDNALITGMHARLFMGMLLRAPRLIGRRIFTATTKTAI
ncbi:MAG TPA: glycosyltransferase family 2 protein [Steroidobacteraceae bacterium]|nr:glycosyltransferase family 2 protein [Steroidobacteraceae bacterium]